MKKSIKNYNTHLDIPSIIQNDNRTQEEVLALRRMAAECDLAESIAKSAEDDRNARKRYASIIMILVFIYVIFVCYVFHRYQFSFVIKHPSLSNSPIIAFLTTTTATVVGILITVCQYLFPNNKHK